ncbi:hypothetical protein NKR19_g5334 [Coniochaeta hoffmannii]|uniref:Uncharacterized protein n=1 Tax=Coniochaeta hoffmannii TaxID=91930 RepID=A0AA38RLB0_9PEZI|nr:hypothetical protein NKR19_g5334 [Coniochaeta hoffmannii]
MVMGARISITPVKELTVYGSLTSKVHFPDELDVKDIVSTVYHLVDNRYDPLPNCPEHLVGNITSVTFQLDHSSNYPILQKLLRQLELSMGETILLPSSVNAHGQVEIMIIENHMFAMALHHKVATEMEIAPLITTMNNLDAVKRGQPGPITEWKGCLDITKPDDPMYSYIIAYGSDPESYPGIIFVLGKKANDQDLAHLMAKIPVRVAVRICPASLGEEWEPGANTAEIDSSTVSVWVYDMASRQAKRVHRPEALSTLGGHIALWGSDLLSVEDATLPEQYQRPYPQQEAFKSPNLAISYADLSKTITAVATGRRTQPVVKHTDDPKFARATIGSTGPGGVRSFSTSRTRTFAPRGSLPRSHAVSLAGGPYLAGGFAALLMKQQQQHQPPAQVAGVFIVSPRLLRLGSGGSGGGLDRIAAGQIALLGRRIMGTLGWLVRH